MSTTDEYLLRATEVTGVRIERGARPDRRGNRPCPQRDFRRVRSADERAVSSSSPPGYRAALCSIATSCGSSGRALPVRPPGPGDPLTSWGRRWRIFPRPGLHALGWLAFESCAYALGAQDRVPPAAVLAHLIVPRVEVRIDDEGVTVSAATRPTMPRSAPLSWGRRHCATHPRASTSGRIRAVTATGLPPLSPRSPRAATRRRSCPGGCRCRSRSTSRRRTDSATTNTPLGRSCFAWARFEAAGFRPNSSRRWTRRAWSPPSRSPAPAAFGRGLDADRAARCELEGDPKEIVEHAIWCVLPLRRSSRSRSRAPPPSRTL